MGEELSNAGEKTDVRESRASNARREGTLKGKVFKSIGLRKGRKGGREEDRD